MSEIVATATAKTRAVDTDVTQPFAGDCDRTRYMKGGKLLCQLRECLCGAISVEGSLPACSWCEKCQSSPAIGPDDHRERVMCLFSVRGDKGMHCGYCGRPEFEPVKEATDEVRLADA